LASLPPAPSKGEKLSPEVEEKIKEWHIIYPIYINNRKKLVDGRRIAKEKGCMNPTCQEVPVEDILFQPSVNVFLCIYIPALNRIL
tara:strand:- start:1284 stop:1541 length:258 start_codon:yes stop_codon:yes gene_type:complete